MQRAVCLTLIIAFAFGVPYRSAGQEAVIVDHTCTDVSLIPAEYIEAVKEMVLWYTGESHSYQIRGGRDSENIDGGMQLLYAQEPSLGVEVQDDPEEFLETGVLQLIRGRYSSGRWSEWTTGEHYYWSSDWAKANTIAAATNNDIDVAIWCWCDYTDIPGHTLNVYDPETKETTNIIPDGETWQPQHMQMYIDAIEEFNDTLSTKTVFVFQTCGVDLRAGEGAYVNQVMNDQMRQWVRDHGGYVFDWADIDAWSADGTEKTTGTWEGHTFDLRHSDWAGNEVGHANEAMAIQKARAMWWLLARIAGWPGPQPPTRDDVDRAIRGLDEGSVSEGEVGEVVREYMGAP